MANKSKMQIVVEAKIENAEKNLTTLKKKISDVETQTEKASKESKGFASSLKNLGSAIAGKIGVISGFVASVGALGVAYFNLTKEVQKNKREVEQLTGLTGVHLDLLTVKVKSVAETFDEDFNEVLRASNTVAKEFGISNQEAMKLVEDGFLKGSNSSGEFLDILKEYPTQLKSIGLDANTTFKLINQQVKEGIYSDKGIDALKEAGLRLREMPKATQDALNAVGISSDEISKSLADGTRSVFEVIQAVSSKLSTLNPTAKETQELITNVFGSAGEDAGARYLSLLKDINTKQDGYNSALTESEQLQKDSLESTEAINKALFKLADNTAIIKAWTGVKIVFAETLSLLNDMFTTTSDFEKNIEKLQGLGFDTKELQTAKQLQETISKNLSRRAEIQKEINRLKEVEKLNEIAISKGADETIVRARNRQNILKNELFNLKNISDVEERRIIANNSYLDILRKQASLEIQLENANIALSKNKSDENKKNVEALELQKEQLRTQAFVQSSILDDTISVLSQRKELAKIDEELKAQELSLAKSTSEIANNTKDSTTNTIELIKSVETLKSVAENFVPLDLYEEDENIDVKITSAQETFDILRQMREEEKNKLIAEKELAREEEQLTEEEFLQFKMEMNQRELDDLNNLFANKLISEQEYNDQKQKILIDSAKKTKQIDAMSIKQKQENLKAEAEIFNGLAGLFDKQTVAHKIFAATEAGINAWLGFSNALALPLPPPVPQILAGVRLASGLKAVSKIAGFEDGLENGVIPGNSFTGDRVLIRANSGEAVLTTAQQRNLLEFAQGKQQVQDFGAINILASKIDKLTDELYFSEKTFNINNELNVTPLNLLEVTEQGNRNRARLVNGE